MRARLVRLWRTGMDGPDAPGQNLRGTRLEQLRTWSSEPITPAGSASVDNPYAANDGRRLPSAPALRRGHSEHPCRTAGANARTLAGERRSLATACCGAWVGTRPRNIWHRTCRDCRDWRQVQPPGTPGGARPYPAAWAEQCGAGTGRALGAGMNWRSRILIYVGAVARSGPRRSIRQCWRKTPGRRASVEITRCANRDC